MKCQKFAIRVFSISRLASAFRPFADVFTGRPHFCRERRGRGRHLKSADILLPSLPVRYVLLYSIARGMKVRPRERRRTLLLVPNADGKRNDAVPKIARNYVPRVKNARNALSGRDTRVPVGFSVYLRTSHDCECESNEPGQVHLRRGNYRVNRCRCAVLRATNLNETRDESGRK